MTLTRAPSINEPGYAWDGSCKCGANDWEQVRWERGIQSVCNLCGWWICEHTLDGGTHTSDGFWVAGRRQTEPPKGCPSLREATPKPNESSVRSVQLGSGHDQSRSRI